MKLIKLLNSFSYQNKIVNSHIKINHYLIIKILS